MKFSKNLSNLIEQTQPDWRDKFLSYKDLKKKLKLIRPKEAEPRDAACVRPRKRRRLADDGGGEAVAEEVVGFVRVLEDEIEKFNAFFVDKEEEYIIRLKVLQDRVAEVQDSNEELTTVGREIIDFHGEMVLLLNYSALNYTGLVKILKKYDKRTGALIRMPFIQKILKKYDKRTGALIRMPFIQKVLQQPFFNTDILSKLVKECETMLDPFLSMKEHLVTYQSAKGERELQSLTRSNRKGSVQNVPEELAEIKNIESVHMKHASTALEVLNKIRSGSSTVSMFSLPPLQTNDVPKPKAAAWKKIPVVEQAAE